MENTYTFYCNIPNDNSAITIDEEQLAGKYPNGRKYDWVYSGYVFDHWNGNRDGSAESFYPGQTLDANGPVVLYAIWKVSRVLAAREMDLIKVADAIREKIKTNNTLSFPAGFINAIESISGDGDGGSENDFIVPIIVDGNDDFVPDYSYEDIYAAHTDGKNICVSSDPDMAGEFFACGYFDATDNHLYYIVVHAIDSSLTLLREYVLDENQVSNVDNLYLYNTSNANATPGDVKSGKVFFNSSGYAVGTGTVVEPEPLSVTLNGTYTAPTGSAYSPVTVNVSNGSSIPVHAKEVNFWDYDGTVVYSYTPAEFAALTAMPANPDHSGDDIPLTAQGWNWTLADAQAYVAAHGRLEIGQMYITADRKTHIKIYIEPGTPVNRMTFYLRWTQSVDNGVTVDWGDGSATQTYNGTSAANHDHTYAAGGWYDITLAVATGTTVSFVGAEGTNGFFIGGSNDRSNSYNRWRIRKVRFGSGLNPGAIGQYCFYQCLGIDSVTIPSGVTSIAMGAFNYCYSLNNIIIPSGVEIIDSSAFEFCYSMIGVSIPSNMTNMGSSVFSNCFSLNSVTIPSGVASIVTGTFGSCYRLKSVTIPSGVTSIDGNAFTSCYSLANVTIPSGVTFIGNNAFSNCFNVKSATIPDGVTTINTHAFSNCRGLTSVTIPSGVTYIAASAFASCYGLGELHFLAATPPTVASSNTFSNLPTDCIIYVPTGSLSAYISATNYPSSSTYTYFEE